MNLNYVCMLTLFITVGSTAPALAADLNIPGCNIEIDEGISVQVSGDVPNLRRTDSRSTSSSPCMIRIIRDPAAEAPMASSAPLNQTININADHDGSVTTLTSGDTGEPLVKESAPVRPVTTSVLPPANVVEQSVTTTKDDGSMRQATTKVLPETTLVVNQEGLAFTPDNIYLKCNQAPSLMSREKAVIAYDRYKNWLSSNEVWMTILVKDGTAFLVKTYWQSGWYENACKQMAYN